MERPAVEPNAPQGADAALPRSPSYELYVAFVVSLIPQAAAVFLGGYGHVITNAPIAVVLSIVDAFAIAVAYLQFREDSHAGRTSHWLVWATIAIGAVWLVYAVFVGGIILFGHIFCINESCRGPIR